MTIVSSHEKNVSFLSLFENIDDKNLFDIDLVLKLSIFNELDRSKYLANNLLEHYRSCSLSVLSILFDYSLRSSENQTLWAHLNKVIFPEKKYTGKMGVIYDEYFLSNSDDVFKNYSLSMLNLSRRYIPASSFSSQVPTALGRRHYVYGENQPIHKITYEPVISDGVMSCERAAVGVSEFTDVDVSLGLNFSVFNNKGEPLLWTEYPPVKRDGNTVSYLNETVLLVKSQRYSPSVYGHWLLDWLPEILFFHRSGLQYDSILIPDLPKFAVDIIEVLAPELLNKLRSYDGSCDYIFKCKKLVLSSSFEATKHPMNFIDPVLLNTLNYYVDKALSGAKSTCNIDKPFLFLSRQGEKRTLTNNNEISEMLSARGFYTPDLASLSFLDQVRLFRAANVIVAPHGSALSNIIFCMKNTVILELFPEGYATNCFGLISVVQKLNYQYMVGVDPKSNSSSPRVLHSSSMNSILLSIQADYYIEPTVLSQWLDVN